jgi:uncharacterized protein
MSTSPSHNDVRFEFHFEDFCKYASRELNLSIGQVEGTVRLLEEGNTIPFIARYRKVVTKGLDERQLRSIEDLLARAKDLAARKNTILRTIAEQGKLTAELKLQIETCMDARLLEDIYLPFKPRKRTRAAIARERGLQPLADLLLSQQRLPSSKSELVRGFVNAEKEVPDERAAIQGACDIVAEQWAENPGCRQWMLEQTQRGELVSAVRKGKAEAGSKFENYFACQEKVSRMPAHRFLAMQRGEAEGILRLSMALEDEVNQRHLKSRLVTNPNFEFRSELEATVVDCYDRLLRPAAESTLLQSLKEKPDKDFPRITIERYGVDDDGHIAYIDLHDEKFGSAIFFSEGSEHRHGFLNQGVYNKKKWL